MKIDIEYIKTLLDVIINNNHPDFRIDHPEIKSLWSNNDSDLNKLVFHMEILADQGLIESSISAPGIGFRRMSNGEFTVSIMPLRLTSSGHQFASDLVKPGVFEILNTTFKDQGPAETIKAVFKLGTKASDKLLTSLIDDD